MTKQNPDELCLECKKFDKIMNRNGEVSFDVFAVCECDEDKKSIIDNGCPIIIMS